MRPITLQIEGFTSFRDLREIDFSELELFVITGPTGSGKTSILDAVTLALYGNVPRTNKRELKDLISLGASQAKVQLDFEVDGQVYRVARRLPHSGAQAATIERIEGEDTMSEVEESGVRVANERIEEIVGLDYDAFTRAVLLPQGAFSEFLKGSAAERREILIRLLDLGRFVQAGKRANEEARTLAVEIEAHEAVLEAEYEGVSGEALEEAQANAKQAAEEANALGDAFDEVKTKWGERSQLQRDIEALEELSGKLGKLRKAIAAGESTWEDLAERDAATSSELKRLLAKKEDAEAAYDEARNAEQELKDEIGDAAALERLSSAAKQLSDALDSIKKAGKTRSSREEKRKELVKRRKDVTEKREAAQAAENTARAALEKAEKFLGDVEAQEERVRHRNRLLEELEKARQQVSSLGTGLEEAQETEAAAKEKLRESRQRRLRIEDENRAAAIREHLHVGDDCPVCGARVTEVPDVSTDIQAALNVARSTEADAEKAFHKAAKDTSRLEEALGNAGDNVARLDQSVEEFKDLPSLEEIQQVLRQAKEAEKAADEDLARTNKETEKLRHEENAINEQLARLKAKLEEAETRLEELQRTADEARETLVVALGDPLPDDYATKIAKRQKCLHEVTERATRAEKAAAEAREEHEKAVEVRKGLERELKSVDGEIQAQRGRLEDRREDLAKMIEAEVPAIPSSHEGDRSRDLSSIAKYCGDLVGQIDAALTEYREDVEANKEEFLQLLSESGIDHDSADLSSGVEALEQRAQAAMLMAETAERATEQLEEKLSRKEKREGELAEKRDRKQLYEKVGKELRKDNFIRFLLNESFHDLALRASDELKELSAGRYSLAASEDSFEVVDHANADERRSVVTLSGGETFLASLALALALAQGIRDIAGHSAAARLESMFIDEGFGTLDPTALNLAVDALERLREGERMVGVITHVPAVAERIPFGIAVEKEEGRTVVELR